jgi:DNA-binding transcriptional MerR regulator
LSDSRSYQIDELVHVTGVSRRNIRLYISMGLLRSVGRRGSRTRYGQEYVDRLNFIQRFKELQDAGKLPYSTLDDLGEVMRDYLSADEVAEAARSNKRFLELFEKVAQARAAERADSSLIMRSAHEDSDESMQRSHSLFGKAFGRDEETDTDWAESSQLLPPASSVPPYSDETWDQPIEAEQFDAPTIKSSSRRSEPYLSADEALSEPEFKQVLSAGPADRSSAKDNSDDLGELRNEIARTRIRTHQELKEVHQLAEEVSELRTTLQSEVTTLRSKLADIWRKKKKS